MILILTIEQLADWLQEEHFEAHYGLAFWNTNIVFFTNGHADLVDDFVERVESMSDLFEDHARGDSEDGYTAAVSFDLELARESVEPFLAIIRETWADVLGGRFLESQWRTVVVPDQSEEILALASVNAPGGAS